MEQLQRDLDRLQERCDLWLIRFNVRCGESTRIETQNTGNRFKEEYSVIFDRTLCFEDHINVKVRTASVMVGLTTRYYRYLIADI